MTREEAQSAIEASITALIENDSYLLEVNANERSISFRLAMYLQQMLPDLNVDCEYNRDGVEPKRIHVPSVEPGMDDTDAITVFPDIIVHRRGLKKNLIAIEIKKSTSRVASDFDYAKLNGYKEILGYAHGLFLMLNVGENPTVTIDWIQ